MNKPICAADTPEAYAHHYLNSAEYIEIFEKAKEFHDFCQSKNVPMYLTAYVEQDTKAVTLFHFSDVDPLNENLDLLEREAAAEKCGKNFNTILSYIAGFVSSMTQGRVSLRVN